MKSKNMYVDTLGKLRIQLKFKTYKHEFKMTGKDVLDKVMERLLREERYEECNRIKKLRESLNNK